MKIDIDFDQLVNACYEGPLEQSPWQSLMGLLQQALAARSVTLLLRPPRDGDKGVVLNSIVLSNSAYDDYNERYFAMDPFVDLPVGEVLTVDDFLDRNTYKKSAFYQEYLKPVNVEYVLGVDLEDENGYSARLRMSRGKEDSNFGANEKALIARLVPHLTRSIVIYSRIIHAETRSQTYQDAFDQMQMGCIILNESLQVLSFNRAAADVLESKRGLCIKSEALQVGTREENKDFRQLIDKMLEVRRKGGKADVAGFRVAQPESVTGLGLLCKVLAPADTPDAGPSIAIFISNPEKPRLSKVTLLEDLFGLTLSEARLAILLANGLSLDEASEELGITRNTAKSHLSATFSKTGVTRQPALVQLILRSVASVA